MPRMQSNRKNTETRSPMMEAEGELCPVRPGTVGLGMAGRGMARQVKFSRYVGHTMYRESPKGVL